GQAPIARVVGEVEVVVPEHEVVAQGGQEAGDHHERDPRRDHPGGGCGTTAEGGRAPGPERKSRSRAFPSLISRSPACGHTLWRPSPGRGGIHDLEQEIAAIAGDEPQTAAFMLGEREPHWGLQRLEIVHMYQDHFYAGLAMEGAQRLGIWQTRRKDHAFEEP